MGIKITDHVCPLAKSGVYVNGQSVYILGGGDGNEGPKKDIYSFNVEKNDSKFFVEKT